MLPSASELTTRIARCIGIWETNRGGKDPKPKESSLDTVSGVRASMATIEQATMPYAIDALQAHDGLRGKVAPPLKTKELADAEACCDAVASLLTLVNKSAANGMDPAAFIAKRSSEIVRTFLTEKDVRTMFAAVALKKKIDAANAAFKAGQSLKNAVASIPKAERMGLGESSLNAYVKDPKKWGEHRAAWQRKAVNAMPGNIGGRIRAVAESSNGTAFINPVLRSRVDKQLKKKPLPSLEQLVKACATPNNPNEKDYGKNVWDTYARLYST